jgi:hypothetical protein
VVLRSPVGMYCPGVERELTIGGAITALLALAGSVATASFAMLSFFDGHPWETAVFALGAVYLGGWAAARLVNVAPEREQH